MKAKDVIHNASKTFVTYEDDILIEANIILDAINYFKPLIKYDKTFHLSYQISYKNYSKMCKLIYS